MTEVYGDIHSRLEGKNDPSYVFLGDNSLSFVSTIMNLVTVFGVTIVSLLGLRFIFIMLSASTKNDFVNFIYNTSHPLVAPFVGIFDHSIFGSISIEPESLIAIIVYSLAAWIINRFLSIFN